MRKQLSVSVPILSTHLLKRIKPNQKSTKACSKIQKCGLEENMATEWKRRQLYLTDKSLLNANILHCGR